MFDIYRIKRHEPRVKLNTRVEVSGYDANGEFFALETHTVDVSPHGASVYLEAAIPRGTEVTFSARDYAFKTRAIVRSVDTDRATGYSTIGVEYLDDVTNPLVIWRTAPHRRTTA